MPKKLPRQVENVSADATSSESDEVSLERNKLDELTPRDLAGSAPLRAVVESKLSQQYLNERIGKLQGKLDAVESHNRELHEIQRSDAAASREQLRELTELRQAGRYAQLLVRDGTVALALGGILVSSASLFADQSIRLLITGFGWGIIILAVWIYKMMNRNIWPPIKATSNEESTAGR